MAIVFWIVLVLFSAAAEVHTNAFVALFAGTAAALDVVLALFGVPFWVQAIFWLAFSGLTIWLVRPLAIHRFRHDASEGDLAQPATAAMTGRRGIVDTALGDEQHPGRVRIQGESWRAVSATGETLAPETPVVVEKVYGTTLWVRAAS